jgi:hypothetical protein
MFDRRLSFSLVKAMMNTILRTFVNCAKTVLPALERWRKGVSKTPPFMHFPIAKCGTKTIAHLPIAEKLSF